MRKPLRHSGFRLLRSIANVKLRLANDPPGASGHGEFTVLLVGLAVAQRSGDVQVDVALAVGGNNLGEYDVAFQDVVMPGLAVTDDALSHLPGAAHRRRRDGEQQDLAMPNGCTHIALSLLSVGNPAAAHRHQGERSVETDPYG